MSPAALSARTYVRYAVPLTVLTALAFAPLLYLAWRAKLPATISEGKSAVRLAWGLLAASLLPMLVLVGGVAPAVRSVATGQPASQLRAFGDGVRGLVAAMVPCALAFMAALLGMLALVVPGLVLLVLFALVGASSGAGAGRLAEAAAVARAARRAPHAGAHLGDRERGDRAVRGDRAGGDPRPRRGQTVTTVLSRPW